MYKLSRDKGFLVASVASTRHIWGEDPPLSRLFGMPRKMYLLFRDQGFLVAFEASTRHDRGGEREGPPHGQLLEVSQGAGRTPAPRHGVEYACLGCYKTWSWA